jgi:hypothetical protein
MGWRFRKSFKVLPGVKLNLSRRGLSATLGGSPFSVNIGAAGVYANASIPGTGISYRQRIGRTQPQFPDPSAPAPDPPAVEWQYEPEPAIPYGMTEVKSAAADALTSHSLRPLQQLLLYADRERSAIKSELASTKRELEIARAEREEWDRRSIMKKLRPKRLPELLAREADLQAKFDELGEQLRLTKISTQVEIDKEQAGPYFALRDAFADLSKCSAIWDTLGARVVDKAAERSSASETIVRELVHFSLSHSDIIDWEYTVPRLENKNGGDMYLYPGFVLYRASRDNFSLIHLREMGGTFRAIRLIESEVVPPDSEIVGETWEKVNKDGGPDRRFQGNRQLPIIQYGELELKTASGLNERYQFSNPAPTQAFMRAFVALRNSIEDQP